MESKNSKSSPMPLQIVIVGIVASFLIISTVMGGIYLGTQTQQRFHNIEQSWRDYTNEAELRGELLNRMWAHLGYGGFIHNFKNYVLRQEDEYLERLEKQFDDFMKIIEEYRQSNPTQFELENLAIIENTILTYLDKIPIAKQAAQENWPPQKTDRLVKVDDREALIALAWLDNSWRQKRQATTQTIKRAVEEGDKLVTVGYRYMAALVIVSLVLFALFYFLQIKLFQTIGKLSKELNERKIAQQNARKFHSAVEQSPATIIITNTKREIEYVNKKFTELTGYSPAEVIGKTPSFLQSGEMDKSSYKLLNEQLSQGKAWQGVFHNKKKNGELYWAQTTIFPLRQEGEEITHYIGLGEDISETIEAQEQMMRVQKMEAVGLLASGVAHDFNNVLTIILGNVFLARQEIEPDSEISHELEQIEIAAKRARNMVGQILSFARTQPSENVPIRVGEIIEEVARLMRASILPNIKISCKVENDKLAVIADSTRLQQVIMNLCSNAAEAIGVNKGEIIISAKQEKSTNGKQKVAIYVSDNGPGIDDAIIDKIFDPFFTTKQLGKGTGLGLSVVASLVHQMKGSVKIEKSDKDGSVFKILLPQTKYQYVKTKKDNKLTKGRGRILLIDDQRELVDICKKILLKMNYRIDDFTSPKQAIEQFEKNPKNYDLVMSDFIMPEISGAQICEIVRKLNPDCPIIIYTAYHTEQVEFEKFAPIRIIEKPVEAQALSKIIKSMIGGKNRAD